MKKILICGLVLTALTAALVGCGKKTDDITTNNNVEISETTVDIDTKAVMDKLIEKEVIMMPMEATEEEATTVYHLNLDQVEEYSIARIGRSPGVGLAVLVEAKDGQVDAVKESVEAILADMVADAFYPMEQEAAEKGKVEVEGNFVYLIITSDEYVETANSIINEALGK